MEFYISKFYYNLLTYSRFGENQITITRNLYENLHAFLSSKLPGGESPGCLGYHFYFGYHVYFNCLD
jgi:hypothetical protein